MVRAFVICLEDRCAPSMPHLRELFPDGVERVPAVDARASSGLIDVDTDPRVSVYFRYHRATDTNVDILHATRPGVIGCALSHIDLWRRCVALGEPIVVCEDDLQGLVDTPAKKRLIRDALAEIEPGFHYASIINIPVTIRRGCAGQWCDIRTRWGHFGTQMYWITPTAARVLLEQALPVVTNIDIYMGYVFSTRRDVVAKIYRRNLYPVFTMARDVLADSAIGHTGMESIKRLLPEYDSFYCVLFVLLIVQFIVIGVLAARRGRNS
jgi:hypothetical protein